MIEIEQPSNIKPGSWYRNYFLTNKSPSQLDAWDLKEIATEEGIDRSLETFISIYNYRQDVLKKASLVSNQIHDLHKELGISVPRLESLENQREKIYELMNSNPKWVSSDEFLRYKKLFIRDRKASFFPEDHLWFITKNNTIERNEFLIKLLRLYAKKVIEPKFQRSIDFVNLKLDYLEKTLPNYLVTFQLHEIRDFIIDGLMCGSIASSYDIYCGQLITEVSKHLFVGFTFTEDQLFDLIRKNEKWHDIDRDLTIYQEKKKGKYLQELADNFGIKFNSISMVCKKVQGTVNYWKGKLFEDFVYKRLKESNLFKDVKKEAGKGESDILAYTKNDNELYIYSLKNIKINRKPYWLEKGEIRPELENAKLCSLDYNISLILLVFDNHNNKVKRFQIDYNNPENIDISK